MRVLPDGFVEPNLLIGPGELFEALNPVIDFRTEEERQLIVKLGSQSVVAKTKEHRVEDQK